MCVLELFLFFVVYAFNYEEKNMKIRNKDETKRKKNNSKTVANCSFFCCCFFGYCLNCNKYFLLYFIFSSDKRKKTKTKFFSSFSRFCNFIKEREKKKIILILKWHPLFNSNLMDIDKKI